MFVASQGTLVVKNPPDNVGDVGLSPGSERFPGGGNGTLSKKKMVFLPGESD